MQCVRAMPGSRSYQCSSREDAICSVDPLSSEDDVVVDFHWFTDCYLEAIFNLIIVNVVNLWRYVIIVWIRHFKALLAIAKAPLRIDDVQCPSVRSFVRLSVTKKSVHKNAIFTTNIWLSDRWLLQCDQQLTVVSAVAYNGYGARHD